MHDTKESRKKIWLREIMGVTHVQKEGLPSKPKSLNYALQSQCENMIGLCQERWQHIVNIRLVYLTVKKNKARCVKICVLKG